jgi:hypothetical protein
LPKAERHEMSSMQKNVAKIDGNDFNVYVNVRGMVPHAFSTARIETMRDYAPEGAMKCLSRLRGSERAFLCRKAWASRPLGH